MAERQVALLFRLNRQNLLQPEMINRYLWESHTGRGALGWMLKQRTDGGFCIQLYEKQSDIM